VKNVSGKLVIIAIVVVALAAAGASWWFRFAATHEAVRFWGPALAVFIRDAPHVELIQLRRPTASERESPIRDTAEFGGEDLFIIIARHEITGAKGLVHLRTALLEDRSFDWTTISNTPSMEWKWGLSFSGESPATRRTIWFSDDCRFALKEGQGHDADKIVSVAPIAEGLETMFSELSPAAPPAR
jgi:hypothetical protein